MNTISTYFKRLRGDTHVNARIRPVELELAEIKSSLATLSTAIKQLSSDLATVQSSISKRDAPILPQTAVDSAAWADKAQPGELAFHKKPNIRTSERWWTDTAAKWEFAGLGARDFEGKVIVDIGAGSRLRTLFFEGAHIVAIEPLAEQFRSEVEWEDLSSANEIYPIAAEVLIEELVDRADLVVSINALDHGYNFAAGINNVSKYLKSGALAYLTFDQHKKPDGMHPLVLNQQVVDSIVAKTDLVIERFAEHGRYHGGPGLKALHYWLRKP